MTDPCSVASAATASGVLPSRYAVCRMADDLLQLTVYTAHGCCLCDDAREVLEPLASELGLALQWVHIDGDDVLEAQWREQIPVGVLDERKVFKYRVDEQFLRRRVSQLRAAAV